MKRVCVLALLSVSFVCCFASCRREPLLHLHRDGQIDVDFPVADIELRAVWDYDFEYDFTKEWIYGWDDKDMEIFGPMGYSYPNGFEFRRYFLGNSPDLPREQVRADHVDGNHFRGTFHFGFYDMLSWSDIETSEGVQAIVIKEDIERVEASTNKDQMMRTPSYPGTRSQYKYHQPEQLFAREVRGEDFTNTPGNFVWDSDKSCWYKKLDFPLQPVTYIYLTQIILHNNNGRIYNVDGTSSLSAMASGVCLNSGVTNDNAITVGYYCRIKNDVLNRDGRELVDVIGGKVMTFGLCSMNPSTVSKAESLESLHRHYLDVDLMFYNGMDSTLVFDVTEQVKRLYKGGVITIDIDVNDVKIPVRPGGSGFDAVVKEPEEDQYEIDI